jgi:DNA-directed RNA polymerase beta' subunit
MVYFQQKMENLKCEYLQSLREYEGRIDELQEQLQRNDMDLQHKNIQISNMEVTIRELKKREKQKEGQSESQLHLKI